MPVIALSAEAVWNTTAGGDSHKATPAQSGMGTYSIGGPPQNLFDDANITAYLSRGNSVNGTNPIAGLKTGFYVTTGVCRTVLTGFTFVPVRGGSSRDPLSVTIEGSNGSDLTKGSNWVLLYNGPTGLQYIVDRTIEGERQNFTNTRIFSNYRFLITSKRAISDFVSYSGVNLYGYSA